MTNTSDSDPNYNVSFAASNVTLPSYTQSPRRKRTKISTNENGSSSASPRKTKPAKKPDPNAPKITPPCTECGKKFWSWKALFGHMRCHPERQWRGINPPPNHQRTAASSPSRLTLEQDKQLASYLLLMANGWNMTPGSSGGGVEGRFECVVCKKLFGSLQELGGHRATTHEDVKGCLAITNSTEDSVNHPPPRQEIVDQDHRSKRLKLVSGLIHKCNICFRVFSSGQALGGHMRCHWERDQEEKKNQDSTVIDLNVPAAMTTVQNLPSSSSDTLSECSLDLTLGL